MAQLQEKRQVIKADATGTYSLQDVSSENIQSVDIIDIDMLIQTKDGRQIVLPEAGLAAMSENPPHMNFSDRTMNADELLKTVSATLHPIDLTSIEFGSAEVKAADEKPQVPAEEVQKRIQAAVEKAVKEAQAEFDKQKEEEQKEKDDSPESQMSSVSSLTVNTESSVEEMVEKVQEIIENIYSSNYDYVPPHEFQPPPKAMTNPPGVPAPISLTPVLTLFTGNIVGNQTVGNAIYGGGGAPGSGADAELGPRNALQFSVNEINGTAGNDVIYAQGNSRFTNTSPGTDISHYAKEILLNVGGYFITLDDIQISNVPANVSIEGATQTGTGTWVLSADYVKENRPFAIVYDTTGVADGTEFDIVFTVTGKTTRAETFTAVENFRFRYIDVTDVDQVTNPQLVYDDGGRLKEIYVLPTSDQPNLINAGSGGNDTIYGGKNADTITAANGNITLYARGGADFITLGNGQNNVDLGDGNSTLISGSGNDTIVGGDGNKNISAGNGNNSITLDIGRVSVTGGSGDDTLIAAGGGGLINLSDGNNSITVGNGNYNVTTGAGNDIMILGDGNNTIVGGDGDNNITVGTGTNRITTGGGNDTLTGGAGDDYFLPGLGNDSIVGGAGRNTIDYSTVTTTGVDLSLVSGTATSRTGTTINTSLSGISDVLGSTQADSITGSTADNSIRGGNGNDTIRGNGGNDTLYGDAGDDSIVGGTGIDLIYGGTGNDTIDGGGGSQNTLIGGAGSDRFINPTAGTSFYGGDLTSASLATSGIDNSAWAGDALLQYAATYTGEINVVDFSGISGAANINLLSGATSGTPADGIILNFFTSAGGENSINGLIGTSGNNAFTGSNANDYLHGGAGGNDTFYGGLGNNTLVGSTGGENIYRMQDGNDTIVAHTGARDEIQYETSFETVINLTGSAKTYVESTTGLTKTVAAWSGAGQAENDYYTPVGGTHASIEYIRFGNLNSGATTYDTVFIEGNNYAVTMLAYYGNTGLRVYSEGNGGTSASIRFYGYDGRDWFYGGAGAADDIYYWSNNSDIADGGGSIFGNAFFNNAWNWGSYSNTTYLDATADINGNGIADYIDRGINLTGADGNTYTGFSYDGLVATVTDATLLKNFNRVMGNSGNDFMVGDNNNNYFLPRGGQNEVYALGGDDIIVGVEGSNTINGGLGTDTLWMHHNLGYNADGAVIRLNSGDTGTGHVDSTTDYANLGVSVFLADATFVNGTSDKNSYWGTSDFNAYQMRTGGTGTTGVAYPTQYSRVTGIERIVGSNDNDTLYGSNAAETIWGAEGNDIIAGNGGADVLYGQAGDDTFYARASEIATVSLINGGAHNAIVAGGAGWSGGGDRLNVAGWTFASGDISAMNSKFVSLEHINVRNGSSSAAGAYSLNQADVNAFLDATGTDNVLRLYLDTNDTFTATGGTQTATGTDATQGTWRQYDYGGTTQRLIVYFG